MPERPPEVSPTSPIYPSNLSQQRHRETSADQPRGSGLFASFAAPASRFSFNGIMTRVVQSVRNALSSSKESQNYQSIPNVDYAEDDANSLEEPPSEQGQQKIGAFEYTVFMLLGVAMLWSWNMFMACATYFQSRFAENEFILSNFQSMILGVSTSTNLAVMIYLSNRQSTANYPYRICTSLILNCVIFTILALSTIMFIVGSASYLVFVLISVFVAAFSCGFSQNGVFAFVNRFGGIYTQAIMTGQGIAGVLPAIAQIASVLAIPQSKAAAGGASPKSAFAYFMTATCVSGLCLTLFMVLLARHDISINGKSQSAPLFPSDSDSEEDIGARRSVPLSDLFRKLKLTSFAIFYNFCITMMFPIFTQAILSVRPEGSGRAFQPDVFIPMAFLLWNVGDLSGRIFCGWERLTIKDPRWLAFWAVSRTAFVPLYFMCNIGGRGAVIDNDLFYWLVELGFGFTSGWVGSSCMMAAPNYVDEDEKEACGGFMGLCLVLGLTTGSILSFFVDTA